MENCVIVFTAKTVGQLLEVGGSGSWKLNRSRALESEYLICARNRHTSWGEANPVAHCAGFLIGKISDVVPAPIANEGDKGRWLILISEYALVDIPNLWKGWRYPVRYTDIGESGVDVSKLIFKPVPTVDREALPMSDAIADEGADEVVGLTIAEAKTGLAKTFGVPPEDIEITIRG